MQKAIAGALVVAILAAAVLWAFWLRDAGPGIEQRAGQPAQREASTVIEEDLPPAGTRSLFDHLLAQNDGLPYPFEELIKLIQRQNPAGEPPLVLMIPDGRSLLKASADYRHPRVLVAADFQAPNTAAGLGFAPRGQLFLGFVENAAEIEVLSYNEAAGRFEFQLVQDYRADGARRIVYARRQICTTCHQGGAPIFPQRPWSETNGQPETAAKIREARESDAPYLGVPLANPLAVPERYDELTDVANFIPVAQRLWREACEADAQCRRQMLKAALLYLWNPAEFGPQSSEASALTAMQAQLWPAAGIIVPESDLPNRDPLAERKSIAGALRALLTRKPPPGAEAKDNEDLDAFDKLPKLPAAMDPLTPRAPKRVLNAQDLDGAYGLAALFSESDFSRLEQAARHDPARLLAAVDRIDESFFAESRAFVRVNAMNVLLAALGESALAYCCLDVAEMSPAVAAAAPRITLAADSPLRAYEAYCFACHRGNPARRLDFMSGADEAEVLANIRSKSEIRDALDWERYKGTDKAALLMPPPDSPQHARLVEALKANPKLIEEMSAVVPGMFDF